MNPGSECGTSRYLVIAVAQQTTTSETVGAIPVDSFVKSDSAQFK